MSSPSPHIFPCPQPKQQPIQGRSSPARHRGGIQARLRLWRSKHRLCQPHAAQPSARGAVARSSRSWLHSGSRRGSSSRGRGRGGRPFWWRCQAAAHWRGWLQQCDVAGGWVCWACGWGGGGRIKHGDKVPLWPAGESAGEVQPWSCAQPVLYALSKRQRIGKAASSSATSRVVGLGMWLGRRRAHQTRPLGAIAACW